MFEQLLLNVEKYTAATVVAQKWMEYSKNFAAWTPLSMEPRKINRKRHSRAQNIRSLQITDHTFLSNKLILHWIPFQIRLCTCFSNMPIKVWYRHFYWSPLLNADHEEKNICLVLLYYLSRSRSQVCKLLMLMLVGCRMDIWLEMRCEVLLSEPLLLQKSTWSNEKSTVKWKGVLW